jgi:hypothetical protein
LMEIMATLHIDWFSVIPLGNQSKKCLVPLSYRSMKLTTIDPCEQDGCVGHDVNMPLIGNWPDAVNPFGATLVKQIDEQIRLACIRGFMVSSRSCRSCLICIRHNDMEEASTHLCSDRGHLRDTYMLYL